MLNLFMKLGLACILGISFACNSKENTNGNTSPNTVKKNAQTKINKEHVRIKTVHGDIVFKLNPNVAPITTARFKELTNEKFYNGLTFHRVIAGFVIQGGDPSGNGTGGSGKKLKAEFSGLKHTKGTVAMARSQDPNSADSQFYIALGPQPHLDGKYTIFGQVTEGMEVLDKIKKGDKMLFVTLE